MFDFTIFDLLNFFRKFRIGQNPLATLTYVINITTGANCIIRGTINKSD